ncbi:lactate utilization protein [Desulfobacterales bacterium HSG2]|nr:lactate utilization protein [Desulfobacterales bacterium HSG2]
METTYQTWLWQKLAEKCVKNLKKHGFDAHFFPTVEESRSGILSRVSDYETFGFGGSDTTRKLGVLEELRSRGKTIYDHWQPGLAKEEDLDIRLRQGRCDCFFCSANAVSVTGEIVNVDGVGNRTNAMTFGPRKVVIVAGMNKVTSDLDSALKRIREIAAPMRAKSLNMETPCAETGICNDCNVPQRICRVTVILHRKPMLTDVSVILVGESLGF